MVSEPVVILRILLAALLSALIGIEREIKHKPAGLRTNVLVGTGSCLLTLVSIYSGQLGSMVDPSRIASSIVTGIGFLGAGLIIQNQDKIHGITTASAIWVVSAIGMAVGIGFYMAAILVTGISLILLVLSRDDKVPEFINKLLGNGK